MNDDATKFTMFLLVPVLAVFGLLLSWATCDGEIRRNRSAACGPCLADSDEGVPVGTLCGEFVCTRRDGWR